MILFCGLLPGCGDDGPLRKETFPVSGQVVIDGQPPSSPVQIMCHPVGGMDQQQRTISQSVTGDEGRFSISTYETGDGAPAGEYVLTFEWGQMNLFSMQYGGPDKLNGRYADPKTSQIKFSVTPDGGPVDLGRIELKTK
jgi:hypothetical protein